MKQTLNVEPRFNVITCNVIINFCNRIEVKCRRTFFKHINLKGGTENACSLGKI